MGRTMTSLALLGKNIAHSKSPDIYRRLLGPKISYKLFDFAQEADIPSLPELFKGLNGLSITAPYKKHFLADVHVMPEAEGLGAINCVRRSPAGYEATNTDYLALEEIHAGLEKQHGAFISRIILGDGSMSRVTQVLLTRKALPYIVLSRKNTEGFDRVDLSSYSQKGPMLVINTCARQYEFKGKLPSQCIFWDHNYSLEHHIHGIPALGGLYVDGMGLLEKQAIHALKFWGLHS